MALFKISKGLKANLPATKTVGHCWYTIDDSMFYIDYEDENGVVQRKALNAKNTEMISGASLATILNASDVEIPTSKAVLDAINENKKEMYGIDVNKNGNVELIFGVKPLINFTIEDRYGGTSFAFETLNCQAEEGMTWENWLNSKYNNIPSSDQVNSWPDAGVVINGYNIYNSDLFTVNPSDVIINNSEYYVTA